MDPNRYVEISDMPMYDLYELSYPLRDEEMYRDEMIWTDPTELN
ncbi:hypothetical protein ACI7RC_02420 [Brevibacillus sp. B_LB10_24]